MVRYMNTEPLLRPLRIRNGLPYQPCNPTSQQRNARPEPRREALAEFASTINRQIPNPHGISPLAIASLS